jgi:hypothetical protein
MAIYDTFMCRWKTSQSFFKNVNRLSSNVLLIRIFYCVLCKMGFLHHSLKPPAILTEADNGNTRQQKMLFTYNKNGIERKI